jgi:TonB family protein
MRTLRVTAALVAFISLANAAIAQSAPADPPSPVVVPIDLPRPPYPLIAQSARVQGELTVTVHVRADGTVASASVTGRDIPLLSPGALSAAQQSHFECRGCAEAAGQYSIVYAFSMEGRAGPSGQIDQPPAVSDSPGRSRVTTMVEMPPAVCAYRAEYAARSAKCLWLWNCGAR